MAKAKPTLAGPATPGGPTKPNTVTMTRCGKCGVKYVQETGTCVCPVKSSKGPAKTKDGPKKTPENPK
jgi:hypothetical protein